MATPATRNRKANLIRKGSRLARRSAPARRRQAAPAHTPHAQAHMNAANDVKSRASAVHRWSTVGGREARVQVGINRAIIQSPDPEITVVNYRTFLNTLSLPNQRFSGLFLTMKFLFRHTKIFLLNLLIFFVMICQHIFYESQLNKVIKFPPKWTCLLLVCGVSTIRCLNNFFFMLCWSDEWDVISAIMSFIWVPLLTIENFNATTLKLVIAPLDSYLDRYLNCMSFV